MNKLAEIEHKLAIIEREIVKEKLRNDFLKRIYEKIEKQQEEVTLTLNKNQLHKLLAVLEHSIISKELVSDKQARVELLDFIYELSWGYL